MKPVMQQMDDLRIALAEVDVLSVITSEFYDREDWIRPDSVLVERVASLLGLISKSAGAAMAAFHRLHGAVADAAPAPAGERWDYDKGTSPGEGAASGEEPSEGMSAEDAAIIRRIRTRSPDRRFDGGTDEELLELFKRNKQVLSRSDEDVIAAMTRPR
jgi:hypothetical protein